MNKNSRQPESNNPAEAKPDCAPRNGSAYYGCSCGDGATAEKSPCGWVIYCDGRELDGMCGAHTSNTHGTLEEAQAEWMKLGGKVYTPNAPDQALRIKSKS